MNRVNRLVAGVVLACGAATAGAASFNYLGQQVVPTATLYNGTLLGGLSGIDYAGGTYYAISDDRSQFNDARYYTLGLNLPQFVRSNTPGMAGVSFNSVTTILAPGGAPYAPFTVDPEAIRYDRGSLYWANEGQRTGAGFQNPTVREMTLPGAYVRDFAVPAINNPIGTPAGTAVGDTGIRNNLAFESLTLSADRSKLYVATENALVQDGPATTPALASPVRFQSFDLASGAAGAAYAYVVDPVVAAPNPAGSFATNGLVEILAVSPTQFLTVERSFSTGVGNAIKLFLADMSGATDVSALGALAGASYTAMSKTLLLDLGTLLNDDGSSLILDNIEGITWGPTLANGNRTLILVSDNNFSLTQFTQFVALEVVGAVPEPSTYALMALGLGLLGFATRRRRTAG